MSIQAVAWALEQDLPQGPKLVLVSIANHADHTTGYCWLKAETIAQEASCSPRSVWRYVGGLVRNGYIRKAQRKGEHGKQRANDYWLMFGRESKEWDWLMQLEGAEQDEVEIGPETPPDDPPSEETPPQDVVEPYANLAHGENAQPCDSIGTRQPVDIPRESLGPCATAGTRKSLIEPSESNPKKTRARASPSYVPRNYRPPPPSPSDPMGAIIADREAKMIFVFANSTAYEAWAKHKAAEKGFSTWNLVTTAIIDGESKRGWWFPSLFPPVAKSEIASPPTQSSPLMTEADEKEFADSQIPK